MAAASTGIDSWPPQTVEGSPYSVITEKILEVMKDEAYELHVTGHRCNTISTRQSRETTSQKTIEHVMPKDNNVMSRSDLGLLTTSAAPRVVSITP